MTDFNPDPIIALIRQADRLEAFPRSGYVLSRVPQPESVAAHAYGVCLTVLLLTDAVLSRPEPPEVDRALVMEMAVLHDIAEAVTTDIPAPVKKLLGRDQVKAAEQAAAHRMLDPVSERYAAILARYDAGQCMESRIVHAADRIQMMIKVLQYETAGLGDLRRFWENPGSFRDAGLPEAVAIFDRLKEHHREGSWPIGDFD